VDVRSRLLEETPDSAGRGFRVCLGIAGILEKQDARKGRSIFSEDQRYGLQHLASLDSSPPLSHVGPPKYRGKVPHARSAQSARITGRSAPKMGVTLSMARWRRDHVHMSSRSATYCRQRLPRRAKESLVTQHPARVRSFRKRYWWAALLGRGTSQTPAGIQRRHHELSRLGTPSTLM